MNCLAKSQQQKKEKIQGYYIDNYFCQKTCSKKKKKKKKLEAKRKISEALGVPTVRETIFCWRNTYSSAVFAGFDKIDSTLRFYQ